ncbi:MAG: hypothetical protein ACR2MF_11195 [Chthoniobacterales bacterium]
MRAQLEGHRVANAEAVVIAIKVAFTLKVAERAIYLRAALCDRNFARQKRS